MEAATVTMDAMQEQPPKAAWWVEPLAPYAGADLIGARPGRGAVLNRRPDGSRDRDDGRHAGTTTQGRLVGRAARALCRRRSDRRPTGARCRSESEARWKPRP